MNGRRRAPSTAYPVQMQRRPRALIIVTGILVIIALSLSLHLTQYDSLYVARGRDAVGKLQKNMPDMSRPFANLHNPFAPQVHPPPVQQNSTWGDASWFSDWKWLNPFSSTVTLDEDRTLLPPLDIRPPIYTYYETRDGKDQAQLKAAEEKLLEIWRRAWWAQGFTPIILGPADAMANPTYQKLQAAKAPIAVEQELMRWLAWSHMGDGILANWLALPMAEFYQPTLTYLRAARYTKLTRYLDLDLGLFTGAKKDIDKALNVFLDAQREKPYKTLMDAINENDDSSDLFHVEAKGKGVAFYSDKVITELYSDISEVLSTNRVKGLHWLANLINAHLHATFLSKYPDGIAVISPYVQDTMLLSHRAVVLANALDSCPDEKASVQQKKDGSVKSCPPNRKDCKPCTEVGVRFPISAPNSTTIFTIGTVPHSYTFTRLLAPHDSSFNFSVPYIRRKSKRDPFIELVTTEMTEKGTSAYHRIIKFKETVAQNGKGARRSIWHTAEADWDWTNLEWRLGFEVTKPARSDESDVNGNPIPEKSIGPLELDAEDVPKSLAPLLDSLRAKPSQQDLQLQHKLIKQTNEHLSQKKWTDQNGFDMRKVSDSWNLADAEAWRFVRAMNAREDLERKKWQDEEGRFKH